MEQQTIQITDESNDRSYFTIIPNYILNHSTAVAQALYLQLKRLGGENGVAYPGSRFLMDKLHISHPTLRKEFAYLLNKGWIKSAGEVEVQTDGGKQKIKAYKIVDLWELNNQYYRGEKTETPDTRGEKIATQGVKSGGEKIATKEDPINKNHSFKKRENKFSPPSLTEVSNYCLERKNGIDAEGFIAFYASKGWKVGSQPMKDWRSAVITWEKRENKGQQEEKAIIPNYAKGWAK